MPRMTRAVAVRPEEDALLGRPRQAALLTAAVVAATVVVFALVADHSVLARIQRVDDAWLRLMISGRTPALTAIAKVFNVLGLVYVTLPVRIALAGYLALRRRWWHLAAFAAAIVASEVLIGSLKGSYDRARPPGSLVATSGASFPSGHAIAASVTVVAAVIALVPAGRRRVGWGAAAAAFSIVMGLSRAYLGAHWLSDAIAGIGLGTSCALVTALVTDQFQRRRNRGRRPGERHARRASVRPGTSGAGERHEYGLGPAHHEASGAVPAAGALPASGRCHPPDRQRPGSDRDADSGHGCSRPADGSPGRRRQLARIRPGRAAADRPGAGDPGPRGRRDPGRGPAAPPVPLARGPGGGRGRGRSFARWHRVPDGRYTRTRSRRLPRTRGWPARRFPVRPCWPRPPRSPWPCRRG